MKTSYSIAAVARLTGLSVDTIRAWERRYGLVRPLRDTNGIRVYSHADVARLKRAKHATGLGHPIRKVAALADDQIDVLLGTSSRDGASGSPGREIVAGLLDALRSDDAERLKRSTVAAATLLEPEDLILAVLVPLLHEVGDLWSSGSLSIWQEHLLSQTVEAIVATSTRIAGPAVSGPGFLFATPPNELHGFGTAFAAMLASRRGYPTYNLGVSVPVKELSAAAKRLDARYVVVGATRMDRASGELSRYVKELDRVLGDKVHLWVGGRASGAAAASRTFRRDVRTISDLTEFVEELSALRR